VGGDVSPAFNKATPPSDPSESDSASKDASSASEDGAVGIDVGVNCCRYRSARDYIG